MNSKLLLVNGITLLYLESQIPGIHENSATLVREIIQSIRLPEISIGIDHEKEILDGLKSTALYMCEMPLDHKYEKTELLQRIKVNTIDEDSLYDAFVEGIAPALSDDILKRTCINLRRSLNNHFKEEKILNIVTKAAYALKFSRNKITNMKSFVSELSSELEPYMMDIITKDPAIISSVNVNNINEVSNVFNDIQEAAKGQTILRTGWQGMNRALGGGFRRGEEWVFGALQHNYKTGMSLSVFMDVALFNTPVLTDLIKKPALVRISCEDPLNQNFQFMFIRLKGIEAMQNGIQISKEEMNLILQNTTPDEMAEYVQNKLQVNGYHTFFVHVNPSMWTYRDICNKILELEADGYEVHLAQVDYILKIPTTGCDGKAPGEDVRNMYERIANFMKAHNVCFHTPHQLSTDAKMLIREGRQDFVRELVGRGYYAGCKQIDQVVDGELFQHIEKVNSKYYLVIQRGKHRKIGVTPEEYLYFVLEFHPVFGLLPDIGGKDSTRKKAGGGPIGSADEIPFWDNVDKVI